MTVKVCYCIKEQRHILIHRIHTKNIGTEEKIEDAVIRVQIVIAFVHKLLRTICWSITSVLCSCIGLAFKTIFCDCKWTIFAIPRIISVSNIRIDGNNPVVNHSQSTNLVIGLRYLRSIYWQAKVTSLAL